MTDGPQSPEEASRKKMPDTITAVALFAGIIITGAAAAAGLSKARQEFEKRYGTTNDEEGETDETV